MGAVQWGNDSDGACPTTEICLGSIGIYSLVIPYIKITTISGWRH